MIKEYRTIEEISEMDMWEMICPASQIIAGIEHTLFAVGNNDLQPQLMGILWDITPDAITFVASNSCKLVRYIDRTSAPGITASCIMPVKG